MDHFLRVNIDNPNSVISQLRDNYPMARQIDRHVIDAAGHVA
jgi:hypothetical protein